MSTEDSNSEGRTHLFVSLARVAAGIKERIFNGAKVNQVITDINEEVALEQLDAGYGALLRLAAYRAEMEKKKLKAKKSL